MKLLMITGLGSAMDLASGKKGAFYNTLEEFSKYWDRIDIIAPKITNHKSQITNKSQTTNSKTQILVLFENVFIHVSPWPLVFHPFWFLKKGLEIYKEQKFDLMTVHDFPPFYNGIGARFLWQKIRIPYVLEFHHVSGYPKTANLKEKIYSSPLLWSFYWKIFGSKAKAARVVNQKQTPEFLVKVGVPAGKITYTPSAYIDLDIFKPMDLPKEYDLIFVGRLNPNKGVSLLLDAVKILNTEYKIQDTKVLIVGDGPLAASAKRQALSEKLHENVIFHGWAKDSREIAELINKSRILVMPSYSEGGPRVVLEAMACGVPVLATPVGIVPDVVRDGKSGRIIDWNAGDIAVKAKELLSDTEEYSKYRRAGLEIAKQFEKKAAIKNYADQLKSLMTKDQSLKH